MRPSYHCPECSLCCSGDSCCLHGSRAHSARREDAGLTWETAKQTLKGKEKGTGDGERFLKREIRSWVCTK